MIRTVENASDTARQTVRIVETPGYGPLGICLISNVQTGESIDKTLAVRTAVMAAAKRNHPESSNGYWYDYQDDASYQEALEKIADVLERHALPMLDAECGRNGKQVS